MAKNNKSAKQSAEPNNQSNSQSDAQMQQMQNLADAVAEHDAKIVAAVDIDNKAVSDVLIIRDSEPTKPADAESSKPKLDSQDNTGESSNLTDNTADADGLDNDADHKDASDNAKQLQDKPADSLLDNPSRDYHPKGLVAKLGKLGAYLAQSIHAEPNRQKSYQAVNIEQDDFAPDAFHEQTASLAKQLLGSKVEMAQTLSAKVLPQSRFDAVGNAIYDQVANLSSKWAMNDLQKDARFGQLDTMSDDERAAFAKDIANQNRALATLGGIAGLAGLKGVLLDTAWLLMISLRTVYQLAAIYGKPLHGKAGSKKAYGVLSGAKLDKLQEKQVILTALALGSTLLANAHQTGVKTQLESLAQRYQESQLYAKQFADLDKFINLDKLNPKWLHKLLPLASVAVGAYYNHELIDEVIGTALASFAGVPADKMLEIEPPKSPDN
ncbi:EcsC family protein [Moraxella marmotae]|uniref:EcsC family protein n=1 Tax=Moraxella marmotae TaxID=3344520 RepID=UPI0035F245F5